MTDENMYDSPGSRLPLPQDELVSSDIIHAAPLRREVRITVSPIASVFLEFYRQGNPPEGPDRYRPFDLRMSMIANQQPMNLTAFRCEKSDASYYTGRALVDVRPLGPVVGALTIIGTVEGLVAGDLVSYAYRHDDIVGGTIRIEVYRNSWDTIINDYITNAGKKTVMNF